MEFELVDRKISSFDHVRIANFVTCIPSKKLHLDIIYTKSILMVVRKKIYMYYRITSCDDTFILFYGP